MNFIRGIFTDKNGNPSSKRLTGFVALGLIVLFSIKGAVGQTVNMEMYYILVGLAGYQGVLTSIERKDK